MTPRPEAPPHPVARPALPRAPWPLSVVIAAVDGYYEAFFSVLIPGKRD